MYTHNCNNLLNSIEIINKLLFRFERVLKMSRNRYCTNLSVYFVIVSMNIETYHCITVSKFYFSDLDVKITTDEEKKQMNELVDAFNKGKAPRRSF